MGACGPFIDVHAVYAFQATLARPTERVTFMRTELLA